MRFSLPDGPAIDGRILSKATRLKIDLMLGRDGELFGDFVIEGVIDADRATDPDAVCFARLLRELLAEFANSKGGGV